MEDLADIGCALVAERVCRRGFVLTGSTFSLLTMVLMTFCMFFFFSYATLLMGLVL